MSRSFNPEKDLLDLTRKTVIVTGGSSGIGYYTIQFLVRRGAKVYMGARNESKARAALSQLESEGLGSLGGTIERLEVDLSHPKVAKEAAERFLAKEGRLDVLVNNAAQLAAPYELTPDGISHVMMTNLIGTMVFTNTLLPLMKETAAKESNADVRIVNVVSSLHQDPGKVDTFVGKESLNKEYGNNTQSPFKRYGHSKLALMLYTQTLQNSLNSSPNPITVLQIHPGYVATTSARSIMNKALPWPFGPILSTVVSTVIKSPSDGAIVSVVAAAGKKIGSDREKWRGVYLVPGKGKELEGGVVAGKATESAKSERLAKELEVTVDGILKDIDY